jgi:hypothetical protein
VPVLFQIIRFARLTPAEDSLARCVPMGHRARKSMHNGTIDTVSSLARTPAGCLAGIT